MAQCKWLENNIDSNGPYFMGEQFSLVVSWRTCLSNVHSGPQAV